MVARNGNYRQQPGVRELQEEPAEENDTCCGAKECAASFSGRPEIARIATSANMALEMQAYLNAYRDVLEERNMTSTLELSILPSLRDLRQDIRHDLKTRSGHYAGFIVPPFLMGDLLEQEGLDTIAISTDVTREDDTLSELWKDLLPYYKRHISSLDGKIRGMPLLAGNQAILFYRRDYLDSLNLPVPVTWGEYIRVAAALHNEPLGPNGEKIHGSCLGRLTEEICRRQIDEQEGRICKSMSMTYIGMTISQMTQFEGSSTGWLFEVDDTTEAGMKPLLNPSLERALVFMEQQLKYGAPDELQSDASINLDLFRQGKCAMTIAVDHPADLLRQSSVGFAPIPGSHNVMARDDNTMVDCTPELCPYSDENAVWGTVNRVPFGATDAMVGAISMFASNGATSSIREFFEFIVDQDLGFDNAIEQPLTYTSVAASRIEGYQGVLLNLTESNNAAAPLRVPNAFNLWSEIDKQVYEYLATGNFSSDARQVVREKVEASWERMIHQRDSRSKSVPTSIFYEKALGVHTPTSPSDLYIGDISRIIGWSLGGLSCFFSLYFALWVWRHQNERVVRASQATFLYMICFGTFMMAGCIFLFGVEDDIASVAVASRSCMASMWLYSVGFVIIFTPLSSKVWLINRMFRKARNMQRIKLESCDILGPLLIIGGINLVILTTWNIQDPVVWVRSTVEELPNSLDFEEIATYGFCNSEHYRAYLGLMLGVNYVVSLVALVQAYECRKISTDYGESLWIGGTLIAIVQVWTVGLPLLKLLDDDPRAIFFVKIGVVFLTTMCTLMLIFLPKVGYLRQSLRNPGKAELGHDSVFTSLREPSITSNASDESPTKNSSQPRHSRWDAQSLSIAGGTVGKRNQRKAPSGLEGIRIIQSSSRHGEEVDELQKSLRHAESRHKTLNDRLERLQEQLEQYIVSRHPHHAVNGGNSSSNFILSARSEQVKLSSQGGDSQGQKY